jgi:EAL domain-containing protein (putative c-di-GMP-specific phosphodiesterase class I)
VAQARENRPRGALADTGLAASRLDLEVTESVLIDDSAAALATLEELRSRSIGVSLDDFGTGFASLAYLNDFPFSKIKIDRKFSQNIDLSPRTSAIIKGIAQTTRDLRMEPKSWRRRSNSNACGASASMRFKVICSASHCLPSSFGR